jgi:hypothetical protein
LLLDPCVIAEVENATAVNVRELRQVIVCNRCEMLAEDSPAFTSSNPPG